MAEHRGRVLLVLCQSLHSGGPCAPKKAPATQNQEVAMHLTTCWAQGSSAWQLASLQEEGTGRSRWLQQCAGLGGARPPPSTFTFCPGLPVSQRREQSVYDSILYAKLTSKARVSCC